MIDFLQELKTVGLTALFNPTFLFLLVVLFFLGKLVGWMTRNINVWKFLGHVDKLLTQSRAATS